MNLRALILEATLPEDDRIVGGVHCDNEGFWLDVGEDARGFLGPNYEAACITAANVDWWTPGRDGELIKGRIPSSVVDYLNWRSTTPDWKQAENSVEFGNRKHRYGWNMGIFCISTGGGASIHNQEINLSEALLELVREAADEFRDFPVIVAPMKSPETVSVVLSSWDSGETWYYEEPQRQFFPALIEVAGKDCRISRIKGPQGVEFTEQPTQRLMARITDSMILQIEISIRDVESELSVWKPKMAYTRRNESESFRVESFTLGFF